MNQDINPLDLIARDLSQSTSPAILLSQNPSLDAVHAAFALYLGLSKMGKTPVIAASAKVNYPIKDIDLIRTSVGSSGDNLVISFPYTDGSIDKVDYRIENNTFNLIVIPRPGFPKVTPEQIAFSYSGGKIDCIITLNALSMGSIGKIFTENQATFDQLPLINIDRHPNNMQYGSVNYVIPAVASVSQLVFDVMRGVQIAIDGVMATQILNGIVVATNNFTLPTANAEVFADVAELMKLGAVREEPQQPQVASTNPAAGRQPVQSQRAQNQQPVNQPQNPRSRPQQQAQQPKQQSVPNSQDPGNRPQAQRQVQRGSGGQPPQSSRQAQNPAPPTKAQPQAPAQNKSWIEEIPQDDTQPSVAHNTQASGNGNADNAPQDWLKPKIFKGNGFV